MNRKAGFDSKVERIFELFEDAAANQRRCPTSADIASALSRLGFKTAPASIPGLVGRLTKAGRIIVKVYGNN